MPSDAEPAADQPRLERYSDDELPSELAVQVRALIEQAWPSDPPPDDPQPNSQPIDPQPGGSTAAGPVSASGHDPALSPVTMVLIEAGTVRACLTLLSKQIRHAGVDYRASGLSTVVTDAASRGRGYGQRLLIAARSALADSAVDLGLFTCDRPLRTFYEAAGWTVLDGTVLIGGTVADPLPSDRFDKVCLATAFSDKAIRHWDSFIGSRIELYPGTLDQLW